MKMNPTYTSAEPVSLWATIMAIGIRIMAAVRMKFRKFPSLYPYWLMTVASMREVDIFDISAGIIKKKICNITFTEFEIIVMPETYITVSGRRCQIKNFIAVYFMYGIAGNCSGSCNRTSFRKHRR